jgi:hypothetical protein
MGLHVANSIPSNNSPFPEHEGPRLRKREIRIYSESSNLKSLRKNTIKGYEERTPYELAIKSLQSIKKIKIPFEQMIIIASISTEITESVNNFWKRMTSVLTPSLLNIEADDLMSIFIYIIINSQMADILVHAKFLKEFTTGVTRSTMIGYYYTTLEASLIYLLEVREHSDLLQFDKRISIRTSKISSLIEENIAYPRISNLIKK